MARNAQAQEEIPVVNLDGKRRAREEKEDSRFFTSDDRREAVAFILIAIAIVLFTALILNPSELRGIDTSEKPSSAGRVGKWIASNFGLMFGFGSLVIPLSIGMWGAAIFNRRSPRFIFAKGLALTLGLIAACAFLGLIQESGFLGGAFGDRVAADLKQSFGMIAWIIVFFSGIVSIVLGTPLSFSTLLSAGWRGLQIAGVYAIAGGRSLLEKFSAPRSDVSEPTPEPKKRARATVPETPQAPEDDPDQKGREYFDNATTRVVTTPALKLVKKGPAAESPTEEDAPAVAAKKKTATPVTVTPPVDGGVKESAKTAPAPPEPVYTPLESYTLPPLTLLDQPVPLEGVTEEDLRKKAEVLRDTLTDFGVECKVGDIVPGPTVTRFEIVPAPGVKVNSITTLQDDIALAMAAPSIRIEAPIPGKSAVGIELPNRKAQRVSLKEVLATEEFRAMRESSPLAVALGQDIAGLPVVADLRRMPHLLIAGATGSGKSVCINSIINSLVLMSKPTEVKMLLVDPKVVELQEYDGIPHLLSPVVTDVRKAPQVLMWAVEEMERRYQFLARAGVRDIEQFNAIAHERAASSEIDDFVDLEEELPDRGAPLPDHMPYLVVVVDEFGDLMMVAAKECEDAIIRIAQMARAVGIHLIIATQRPSVDVITGVIKANLPSRIAFLVSSKVDSRTILDSMGAERLLGRGDMLFKPGDRPKPVRLQGCYIGGGEMKKVIKHYSDQGAAKREFTLTDESMSASRNLLAGDDDPLLKDALRIVLEDGMASVSRIQRRLKIGHPRAARLVDIMEAKGLVTPPDGSKPRQLLFDNSYLESMD